MCVKNRSTDTGRNIAVLYHTLFKQCDINDLADKRPGEGLQTHVLDPVFHIMRDFLRCRFVSALVPIKGLDQFSLLNNLSDNAIAIPFDDMPVRCPDGGEQGNCDSLKSKLLGLPVCHYSPDISFDKCSPSSLPAGKRSAEV